MLLGLTTGQNGNTGIQHLSYRWDLAGNLLQRQNHTLGAVETFAYDTLYRLSRVQRSFTSALPLAAPGSDAASASSDGCSTPLTTCLAYDAIGNIIYKGDTYSNYRYGKPGSPAIRPHAVNAVTVQTESGTTTRQYQYDANGNLIKGGGNTLTWSSYNKPLTITDTQTGYYSQFRYGPGRARYWQQASTEKGITTTWYVGSAYERVTDNSGTQHRFFIRAGGQVIAVHKEQTTASSSTPSLLREGSSISPSPLRGEGRGEGSLTSTIAADPNGDGVWTEYLHRNHQGSIVAVTNSQGELLARYSYNAWGKRRNAVSWDTGPLAQAIPDPATTRGYTGHEHLDHLGLIHMNGRVYAPEIGRFLSADPFMQFPESTQGLNRYSYVVNNPLSYTDPSGFSIWETLGKWMSPLTEWLMQNDTLHSIGVIALNFVPYCQVWCAAVANGIRGYMMTGSDTAATKSATYTAASAAAAWGIGTLFEGATSWQAQLGKAVTHGIAQGALSSAGGGRFGDGFLGGFASSLAGPYIEEQQGSGVEGVIIAAVIGGTVAEIGGGKFANGAISAAFVFLFNEMKHRGYDVEGDSLTETQKEKMNALLVDIKDALKIVDAPWLQQLDRVDVIVSANEKGSNGQAADARIIGGVGVVTIYRISFQGTQGDLLALFGHELYHFKPSNYAAYQRLGDVPATQWSADRFGNKLASALVIPPF